MAFQVEREVERRPNSLQFPQGRERASMESLCHSDNDDSSVITSCDV